MLPLNLYKTYGRILDRITNKEVFMRIFEKDGITFIIEKKKVKRLSLTLKKDGNFVSVPSYVSYKTAEEFISDKIEWVKKHRENSPVKKEEKFLSGDEVSILGERYNLEIFFSQKKKKAEIINDKIFIYVKNPDNFSEREKAFMDFCKDVLEEKVPEILKCHEEKTGLCVSKLRYRIMKSRWGSCNVKTKEICLNTLLATHPVECLSYVVLHEIIHIEEPSHNARFKSLMTHYMPDWKERKAILNK